MIGVVHLVTFLDSQVGGMERQALRLVGYLQSHGCAPFFITCAHVGKMRKEKLRCIDTINGCRVYRIPFFHGWRITNALLYFFGTLVLLCILQRGYRIIHAHQLQTSGLIAAFARLLLPTKRVIVKNCCGGEFGDIKNLMALPGHQLFLPLMRRCVDRFIAVSPETEQEMRQMHFANIQLIPNGVDTNVFAPVTRVEKRKLREQLMPRHCNKKILLFVGRLTEQKNLFILFDAVALLPSDVVLLLVGDGNHRGVLEEYTIKKGIMKRIIFWGSVPDARDFYRVADIFILPSRAEGMPNVLLEAMSSGIVCIGSDIPAINTIITHQLNGLLFFVENSAMLAQQISETFRSPSQTIGIQSDARRTIAKRFSLDSIARTYLTLYQEIL